MPNDWFGVSSMPYCLMLQSELDAKQALPQQETVCFAAY